MTITPRTRRVLKIAEAAAAAMLVAGLLAAQALVPMPTAGAQAGFDPDVTGTVVAVVGDLVPDESASQIDAQAVHDLVLAHDPDVIIMPGDLVYECGTTAQWTNEFEAIWGDVKAKIRPVVGNHEYCGVNHPIHKDLPDYHAYWGDQATPGDNNATYYSFDLNLPSGGHAHFQLLNSNCLQYNFTAPGCGVTQAMRSWMRDDLAADSATCELIAAHEPAFGEEVPFWSAEGGKVPMRGPWETAEVRNVDYALAGHAHNYQRYASMDHNGDATSAGMPSAIVGTGGRSLHDATSPYSWPSPKLQALDDTHFGFLKMVFTDSTHWTQAFKATNGSSLDAVSYGCS